MTKDTLKQLSKDALEELGRTKGIELDKRFNKSKLVNQIAAVFKKEEKAAPAAAPAPSVTNAGCSSELTEQQKYQMMIENGEI